jgi:hypothetical protein
MRRAALVLALSLLLAPLRAAADDEPEPIAPDRAGASLSTNTVGRGAVQIETGLAYLTERMAGAPTERRLRVEAGLRAGVTEALELRIEGFPLIRVRGADDETGHGDFLVSAKYRFLDSAEGSWLPSLGVFPFVKLPVAEEPLGSGKTDFGALLLASFSLPGKVSLDIDAGLVAVGQLHPSGYLLQAVVAAGLSRDVAESVTLFTDMIYASRDERARHDGVLVDLGVVWRPTRNVALDLSAVTSATGSGPDWAVRAGVSIRFGR